jgi:hypothetical protein
MTLTRRVADNMVLQFGGARRLDLQQVDAGRQSPTVRVMAWWVPMVGARKANDGGIAVDVSDSKGHATHVRAARHLQVGLHDSFGSGLYGQKDRYVPKSY